MDLHDLEYAAVLLFNMLKQHPELCPHRYEWHWSQKKEDGTYEHHFVCKVCGNEHVRRNRSEKDRHF